MISIPVCIKIIAIVAIAVAGKEAIIHTSLKEKNS